MRKSCLFSQFWIFPALAVIPLFGRSAQAQVVLPRERTDAVQDLVAPPSLRLNFANQLEDAGSPPRPDRFQLFRMPAGFITNPVGLDSDDDDPPPDPESATAPSFPGEDRLQLILGQDNPFFDFRYPGDPGGAGYYRLHTQYQLLDSSTSGLCLGLRAVTPAGLEADGLAHGPTILSPALAWYQDLGGIASLHGYIGKNLRATNGWTDSLERSIHYGVAVQQPIPGLTSTSTGSLHFFVEALGRQRSNPDLAERPPFNWEVLPGLHWQMGENWWMSGGLLLPMGASRLETNLWQITCSWRF